MIPELSVPLQATPFLAPPLRDEKSQDLASFETFLDDSALAVAQEAAVNSEGVPDAVKAGAEIAVPPVWSGLPGGAVAETAALGRAGLTAIDPAPPEDGALFDPPGGVKPAMPGGMGGPSSAPHGDAGALANSAPQEVRATGSAPVPGSSQQAPVSDAGDAVTAAPEDPWPGPAGVRGAGEPAQSPRDRAAEAAKALPGETGSARAGFGREAEAPARPPVALPTAVPGGLAPAEKPASPLATDTSAVWQGAASPESGTQAKADDGRMKPTGPGPEAALLPHDRPLAPGTAAERAFRLAATETGSKPVPELAVQLPTTNPVSGGAALPDADDPEGEGRAASRTALPAGEPALLRATAQSNPPLALGLPQAADASVIPGAAPAGLLAGMPLSWADPVFGGTVMALQGPDNAAPERQSVSPAAVLPQIIAATTSRGAGLIEVTLSPAELGRVSIEMLPDAEGLRVTVAAERPETLDLLRRHADQLLAELREAGFAGADLSFGKWGGAPSARQAPDDHDDPGPLPAAVLPPTSVFQAAHGRNAAGGGGLNLRL